MDSRPLFERLTRLILSLSSNQKRNFKLYARSNKELNTPRYIKLFDLINKVSADPEFDGNLVDLVVRKKVLRIHELSRVANYLYSKILESMRKIPETHKSRIEVVNILQDCRFLISKEMYDEGAKELKRAAALLNKLDYPELELELLLLQSRLISSWWKPDVGARLAEVHSHVEGILSRLQKDNDVFHHNVRLLNSFALSKPLPPDISTVVHRYILELNSEEIPFGIRFKMLLAIANYHRLSTPEPQPQFEYVIPSKEDEYEHLLQMVQIMRMHREQEKEDPSNYLEILVRFLSTAIDQERWGDFHTYSLQLEKYKNTTEFYRNSVYIYLLSYLKQGDFDNASAYISKHQLQINLFRPQHHVRPSRRATICFYCTVVSLVMKKVDEAVFWLEKIISHKPVDSMPALRCTAQFLRILLVSQSLTLAKKYNPEKLMGSLKAWIKEHHISLSGMEDYFEILACYCADPVPKNKARSILQKVKAEELEFDSNYQMGVFVALAESYLYSKPFEAIVKPYL